MEERLLEMEERGVMESLERKKEQIEREIEMLRRRLRTQQRPESPEPGPSCVSFKSDQSKQGILDFKGDEPSAEKRIHQRTDSAEPEPSCVSFNSDCSKQDFKGQQPSDENR
ncbi:hypothetical protein PFLUV_G00260440 [Perca fluviatilis]|uniref:Uncharacterized protein n=1 Tax=Perca fluviatilis TaxID=8168 RepID=A0A6A5EE06_PERFL|nr:hypothetical protein PFLUV_G00260440 [Perca fluviatilis]